MAYHLNWRVFREENIHLEAIRSIKDNARFVMGQIDPSWGEIPDWNENPEAFAAYEEIAATARELEKATIKLLAVYERQELSDNPDTWEFADSKRSA